MASLSGSPNVPACFDEDATTKREITVILAGKSGAGKSTLAKNVFGADLELQMSASENTKQSQTYIYEKNGITMKIIDTIGFTGKNKKKQLKEISKHVDGQADLLLYCLPISPGSRFEDCNPEIMKSLQDAFGEDIWRHCMVVLTFSNLAMANATLIHGEGKTATDTYIGYIDEYVKHFKEELRKLEVCSEKVGVRSVFELDPDEAPPQQPNKKFDIIVIPAGFKPKDEKILLPAGFELEENELPGVLSAELSGVSSAESDRETRGGTPSIRGHKDWATTLVNQILQRTTPEFSRALLQFWYNIERLKKTFKEEKVLVAAGGGSAAGATVGGIIGGGVGALITIPGLHFGLPVVGISAGVCIGGVIGAAVGGSGAAGVTHLLQKKDE